MGGFNVFRIIYNALIKTHNALNVLPLETYDELHILQMLLKKCK